MQAQKSSTLLLVLAEIDLWMIILSVTFVFATREQESERVKEQVSERAREQDNIRAREREREREQEQMRMIELTGAS